MDRYCSTDFPQKPFTHHQIVERSEGWWLFNISTDLKTKRRDIYRLGRRVGGVYPGYGWWGDVGKYMYGMDGLLTSMTGKRMLYLLYLNMAGRQL